MCLLVYKNAGVSIPEGHLKEAFDNNSHGAGFSVRMVNEAGEGYLHRERGFFKYNDFIEAYRPFALQQGIIHFRLATAGKQDEANCHPFETNPCVHMGHNGIISIAQSVSKDYSDTWHYNELVCKPMYDLNNEGFWTCQALHFLLDQTIGSSKLAFLHADGRYLLINEAAGHWDNKENPQVWYSNDSYEVPRYSRVTKYTPAVGFGAAWNYSAPVTQWEADELKRDAKLLARAKEKLAPSGNDWLVDEAYDTGMEAMRILTHSANIESGPDILWNFVYGQSYRDTENAVQ